MAYVWLKDGTPLHFIERGSGMPLVLLPALMYSARHSWRHNLDELSAASRVIALDMRGQGESGKPNFGYTIPALAHDLHEFLEIKHVDRAVVVGVALGGLVLLEYLECFGPKRIAAIAIVEMTPRLVSAPGWAHPTFGEFPPEAAAGFGAGVLADKSRAGLRDFFAAGYASQPSETAMKEIMAESYLTPTDVVAHLCDEMVKQDKRHLLPNVPVPTLLMYGGAKNRILPTGVGPWMSQQIPGSRYVEFAASGHNPFIEEPAKFNAELLAFVREIGKS